MDIYHIYSYQNGAREYIETVFAGSFRDAVSMAHETVELTRTLELTKSSGSGNVTKILVGGSLQKSQPVSRASLPDRFRARLGRYFSSYDRHCAFLSTEISHTQNMRPGLLGKMSFHLFSSMTLSPITFTNPRMFIGFAYEEFDGEFPVGFSPSERFSFGVRNFSKNTVFNLFGKWNYDFHSYQVMFEKESDLMVHHLTQ